MAQVKILSIGEHHKNSEGKLVVHSTIILIKGEKNFIVDAGSFLDKEKIIEGLKQENLTCDDIDYVILTHLHLDHIVNVNLFKNAKILLKFKGGNEYPGQMHVPASGYLERYDLVGAPELDKDVKIILTPGHTPDMISVVVKTNEGVVVIAGDAFPSEDFQDIAKQPDPLFNDVFQFNESRKKILEIADFIIPGHGDIFKVKK